ncbi:hypothetical protein ABPG77_006756 [Micractinium sp. CCAP 211/92]
MEAPPKCRCGEPAELRTVRKEGPNQGRHFWGCPRFPDAAACKFFQWAEPGAGGDVTPSSQQQGSWQHGSQQQWQSQGGSQQPQQWQSPSGPQPPQQWHSPTAGQHPSPYSQARQHPPAHTTQHQSPSLQQRPWQQQQQPQQHQPQHWSQPPSQATPASTGRPRYASPASLAAAGKPYIPPPSPGSQAGTEGWVVDIDLSGSPPARPSQRWQQPPASGAQGQWGGSQGGCGRGSQETHGGQPHRGDQVAFGGSQGERCSQQAPALAPPQPRQQQAQLGGPGGSQSPGSLYGTPPGSQEPSQPAAALPLAQPPGRAMAVPPAGLPQRNRDGMIMGGQGHGPPVRINLQVLDSQRFGAQFKYNETLKGCIKGLAGAVSSRWDPAARMWTFARESYIEVLRALQGAPLPILISPLPEGELETPVLPEEQPGGTQLDEGEVQERLRRLPSELWQRLYSFQRDGVRRGVAMGGRCLIADEMGLGKTVQALMIAACFAPKDWPLLIITPATMKLVWQEAVRTWLPPELSPSPRNLAVITDGASMESKLGGMDAGNPVRVAIVSYDMAKKLEGRSAEFRTIIADESHLLKTLDAQRTRAVAAMARSARRAILCTGTPALARPLELFPQIDMLRPGLFGTLREFGMRYCDGRPAEFPGPSVIGGYDFRGSSNLGELSQRLERHLMIRRLKEQVLGDLPEKIRKRIPVETDPDHRAALLQTRRAMEQVKRDEAGGLIDAQTAALSARRLAGELYRQTGPAKVAAAAEHVRALLDAGQKVLVFAHHTEVLDALQQRALAGTPFLRIDGQVSNDKRKALVDRFQQDERCRAALLSITAAGVGITLTAASVVVFAELYWNPGSLVQAEDRAHRMGQRQALEVHYLVAPGTADDAIWQTCKHKLAVVGDTLGQERAEEGEPWLSQASCPRAARQAWCMHSRPCVAAPVAAPSAALHAALPLQLPMCMWRAHLTSRLTRLCCRPAASLALQPLRSSHLRSTSPPPSARQRHQRHWQGRRLLRRPGPRSSSSTPSSTSGSRWTLQHNWCSSTASSSSSGGSRTSPR